MPVSPSRGIAALCTDHNRSLLNFLVARLKCMHDAREVAQEAYIRLLQLDLRAELDCPRAYLFRVAANLATDHLRKRVFRRGVECLDSIYELTTGRDSTEASVVAADEFVFIRRCLHELPDRWRDAFIRHRIHGESIPDIARAIGVSDRMTRNYITRTLAYCRARLDGAPPDEARGYRA